MKNVFVGKILYSVLLLHRPSRPCFMKENPLEFELLLIPTNFSFNINKDYDDDKLLPPDS